MNNKRDSLLQVSERNNGPRGVMSSSVLETAFHIVALSFCFSEPSENSTFADSSTETRLNAPQGTILRRHSKDPTVRLLPQLCRAVALTPPADGNSMKKVINFWKRKKCCNESVLSVVQTENSPF